MSTADDNRRDVNAKTLQLAFKIEASIKKGDSDSSVNVTNLASTLMDMYTLGASEALAEFVPNAAKQISSFDLNKAKSLLLSKTFWGVAISSFAMFAPKMGLHISSDQVTSYAASAVGAAGTILAIYGRLSATGPVTVTGQ